MISIAFLKAKKGQVFNILEYQTGAAMNSPSIFIEMNDCFSKRKHGVSNLSGTNLNIRVYDNGLKGAGQEARSNYDSLGS